MHYVPGDMLWHKSFLVLLAFAGCGFACNWVIGLEGVKYRDGDGGSGGGGGSGCDVAFCDDFERDDPADVKDAWNAQHGDLSIDASSACTHAPCLRTRVSQSTGAAMLQKHFDKASKIHIQFEMKVAEGSAGDIMSLLTLDFAQARAPIDFEMKGGSALLLGAASTEHFSLGGFARGDWQTFDLRVDFSGARPQVTVTIDGSIALNPSPALLEEGPVPDGFELVVGVPSSIVTSNVDAWFDSVRVEVTP